MWAWPLSCNQGLIMVDQPVDNCARAADEVSQELLEDDNQIQHIDSDELFWYDAHFGEAEPSERMFKSLPPEASSPAYDCYEALQRRSLDDMSSYSHPNCDKGLNANGKSNVKDDDDDDDDDDIDIETMKNKFLSAWTNAKNGWIVRTATSFRHESPIWLLGIMYKFSKSDSSVKKKDRNSTSTSFNDFKLDFKSRIWFTYRTELPSLPDSRLKSDIGWGCMLRCGQMLLSQALIFHFLRREWRWTSVDSVDSVLTHRQIISYFGDTLSPLSPFSIQKLISVARESGKKAGDWFGPASVANALWSALKQHQEVSPESLLQEISIYVARDGVVYTEDLLDECQPMSSETLHQSQSSTVAHWRSVVIIVPMRLGGELMNPMYVPCLKALMNNECCLGIIGGKPRHSLYFIGWQEEKLIYLDPHRCQEFVNVHQPDFPLQSFHCMFPRKLSFSRMDPSCAIAFYCQTRSELNRLLLEIPKVARPPLQQHYPMFDVNPGRHSDSELPLDFTCASEKVVRMSVTNKKRHSSADEFTLL